MNEISSELLVVEGLLAYVEQQLGTRARTVLCRSAVQLRFLAGDDITGTRPDICDDSDTTMSLTHDLDAWKNRIALVEKRMNDGDIPENWEELLKETLSANG